MNAFTLIKVDPITLMNWMAVTLVVPAAALLAWKYAPSEGKGETFLSGFDNFGHWYLEARLLAS